MPIATFTSKEIRRCRRRVMQGLSFFQNRWQKIFVSVLQSRPPVAGSKLCVLRSGIARARKTRQPSASNLPGCRLGSEKAWKDPPVSGKRPDVILGRRGGLMGPRRVGGPVRVANQRRWLWKVIRPDSALELVQYYRGSSEPSYSLPGPESERTRQAFPISKFLAAFHRVSERSSCVSLLLRVPCSKLLARPCNDSGSVALAGATRTALCQSCL